MEVPNPPRSQTDCGSRADRWSEAKAESPIIQPTSPVWRPGTWARLGDPPTSPAKYWDRRGKEELSKPETPTGMEARRQGGRRQGSHCPEEIPGKEFGSPDRGALERTRSKLLMQGNIGEDSVCSTLPHPNTSHKKELLGAHDCSHKSWPR